MSQLRRPAYPLQIFSAGISGPRFSHSASAGCIPVPVSYIRMVNFDETEMHDLGTGMQAPTAEISRYGGESASFRAHENTSWEAVTS